MVVVIVVFLFVFAAVSVTVGLGFLFDESRRKVQMKDVLKTVSQLPARMRKASLVLPESTGDAVANIFDRFQHIWPVARLLRQSGLSWSQGNFLVFSLFGAGGGFLLGGYLGRAISSSAGAAVFALVGGAAPFLFVLYRRGKTIAAFEDQLPEALDFLSRSLRAGHGLSTGLELLATESPDPSAAAFRRVANELQLGSSLQDAMSRLIDLVPLVDMRFFVSSVLLQQETGGNLSEVLTKLSHIIRERFQLRGKVSAMSAHGRITGMILLLMPVVVAIILFLSSPEYLFVLLREKEGRYMLWGALGGQILAYFTIRKIVNIQV